MTQTIVRCKDCDSLVELARKGNGTLALACDCPHIKAAKVRDKIPEGWEE